MRIQGGRPAGAPPGGELQQKSLQSAIEALPPVGPASLKAGDAVILSCTNGEDASQATAITLLAGVEPLFKTTKGGRTLDLGSWNLDLNIIIQVP